MNNASIPVLFVAITRPASRDKRRKGTLRRRKTKMKTNRNIRKGKMSGKGRVIVQIRKKKEKRWNEK